MGRIGKIKRNLILEANRKILNEQATPPAGARLNLFCTNNRLNDSTRETDLTASQEQDLPNGVKRLYLTRSGEVLDKVAGDAGEEGSFTLDITPVSVVGDKFSGEFDATADNIVLITFSGPRQGVPYFCALDAGTDQAWANYFNTF